MSEAADDRAPARAVRPRQHALRALLQRTGPLLGLLVVWSLFALLTPGTFATWDNQRLMLLQTSVIGIAALGATLVIVSGGIDLSVGASIALGTVVVAWLLREGCPPAVAAAGGVATGALIGVLIGAIVVGHVGTVAAVVAGAVVALLAADGAGVAGAVLLGVATAAAGTWLLRSLLGRVPLSPFIVTLAMWGALRGAAKRLGDDQPVYPPGRTWLDDLMQSDSGAGLPIGVWLMLLLAVAIACVLRYTRFGRHVFAIGSNEQTARLCGVDVERTKLLIYALAVGCAGVAALLQFSYLSMGDPTTAEGYELEIIAAVVIGGASLSGGEGSILGTLVGALIMTIVDNGCTKLGLANSVQDIVTGAIIVAAVVVDRLRHRAG